MRNKSVKKIQKETKKKVTYKAVITIRIILIIITNIKNRREYKKGKEKQAIKGTTQITLM